MRAPARLWIVLIPVAGVFYGSLSAGQSARADLYAVTITAVPPPDDVSTAYNGRWVFDVSMNAARDTVTLRVVSGNNASNTATYRGVSYSFSATLVEGTNYSFSGTSLSTPARGRYNLGASGFFDPVRHTFSLNNPVTSQLTRADGTPIGPVYRFNWSSIQAVPEPSSAAIAVIALGTLGASLALKRRSRPAATRTA